MPSTIASANSAAQMELICETGSAMRCIWPDPGRPTTAWMLKNASVFHGTGGEVVSMGVGSVPDVLRTSVTSLGLADVGEHCLPVSHIIRASQAGVLNPNGDLGRVASACPAVLDQWSAPSPADGAEAIGNRPNVPRQNRCKPETCRYRRSHPVRRSR